VVLGPEAVATVLTFLGVYGFNAKSHLEGSSFVHLGEQQLDEAITLRNDPTDPRAVGLPFDAEGTPRRATTLIEAGTCQALAHDRRTARRAGTESTGDALPAGASIGAVPTTLVLTAGQRSPDELVGAVRARAAGHPVPLLPGAGPQDAGGHRADPQRDLPHRGRRGGRRRRQPALHPVLRGRPGPGRVLGVGDDDRYAAGEFGAGMVICPSLQLSSWTFTGGASG
jgi:hypothetical protein